MKRAFGALAILVAAMTAGSCLGTAWAYFTTYAEARGGHAVELGDETEITEEFSNWTKRLTVRNEEGAQPVYVRARAFCGSRYRLSYSSAEDSWSEGADGYYYYDGIVGPGEATDELLVGISGVPEDEDLEDGDGFNVVVIYESTPVRYDAEGNPKAADWTESLDVGDEAGGVRQ